VAAESTPIFESYSAFEKRSSGEIDWVVENLIQRGANGLVLAAPKGGKSIAIADLAIALASGQPWLEFDIPRRVRVAVVSREDYWALTHARMKRYRESRALFSEELDDNLRLNCRGAQPGVMLDNPDDVAILIGQLKKYKTEFLIFDVLRVLHSKDENDSTEIQRGVLNPLNRIAEEVGCSICMIHHSPKDTSLGVSRSARGTSAIFGWAEFAIGISMADEETRTREIEFQLKAADAPQSFYWRAVDTPGGMMKLSRVNWTPPPKHGGKNREGDTTWWNKESQASMSK
jgi:RecA-family ATPase